MSNKKELNAIKEEVKALNKKPRELTAEEVEQVTGGINSKSNHKGDVITYKLDVPPVTDEVDVVEMSTSNTAICKGDNLLPAEIDT